ncbi:hypothetical protein EV363DRAFT_1397826 [Boletus edulis]|nr:hypothetical protein EV363DRAFT_1397826 [Boletus edulis]
MHPPLHHSRPRQWTALCARFLGFFFNSPRLLEAHGPAIEDGLSSHGEHLLIPTIQGPSQLSRTVSTSDGVYPMFLGLFPQRPSFTIGNHPRDPSGSRPSSAHSVNVDFSTHSDDAIDVWRRSPQISIPAAGCLVRA